MSDSGQLNDADYMTLIKKMISELKFGTITILVQDRKVVQINKEEKIRIKS